MIDCYTWTTDNGYKPRMMLEETGLPYKIIPVHSGKGTDVAGVHENQSGSQDPCDRRS
jgi:glutathione S-transferase